MSVSLENQIAFYDWQLREMDLSWAKYHGSNILDLYSANDLYIGRIWGYDEKRGVLILRFKQGKFPRLKVPLTLSYPKSTIGVLSSWSFTYGEFREKYVEQFSNCTPMFYLQNEFQEEYRYVGVKNVSMEFLQHIRKDLAQKTHSIIILGTEDPPRDYLVALKHFTKSNPSNKMLNLSFSNLDSWNPKSLSDSESLVDDVVGVLRRHNQIIIQGPPGTGKTYLIAKICEHYLNQGSRVCVTALTHKALTEVATKDGLKEVCNFNKVFKTNLSADESALIPGIQNHDVSKPTPSGTLLLATYYSLSKLLMKNESHVHFDLIIIEEASQAFLTTLAGFASLGSTVLIVGDFMQLQPIVLEERRAINIDRNIATLVQGLRTYSGNNTGNSYRLVNSYRLTERSAAQTGLFYSNSLQSKSHETGVKLHRANSDWFCPEGGTSLIYMNGMDEGKIPTNAITLAIQIVNAIKQDYPEKEVAVLSAFKDTVNAITDLVLKSNISFENLEVNTVDRIQGMTVDLCIYLVPSYKTKFSFHINRFNVATSRSRNGTLIIMEDLITNRKFLSNEVMTYLDGARTTFVNAK
jgi:hypothetical protein